MRTRYRLCPYCGDLHNVAAWPANHMPPDYDLRSDLPAPAIITDTLPGGIHGMRSMADGKVYDSKQRYYASLKASGHEIVGNDSSFKEPERKYIADTTLEQDVRDAKDMLSSDMLSDGEMANMMRAISPVQEIIPNG